MRGVQGKSGWFWLFLLEGLLTFAIGITVRLFVSTRVVARTDFMLRINRVISTSLIHLLGPKASSGVNHGTLNVKRLS